MVVIFVSLSLVIVLSFNLWRVNSFLRSIVNNVARIYTNLVVISGLTAIASITLGAYTRYAGINPSFSDDWRLVYAIPYFDLFATLILLTTANIAYYFMRILLKNKQNFVTPQVRWVLVFNLLLFFILFGLCLIGD